MNCVCLKPIADDNVDALNYLEGIYLSSFPEDERRPWDDLLRLNREHALTLLGIYTDDELVGLITRWQFDRFAYVEHFAVDPSKRSNGVGKQAILQAQSSTLNAQSSTLNAQLLFNNYQLSIPLVVEVEHADVSDEARRRIGFYQRCGFSPLDGYDYVQPPYAPHLKPVRLLLMSTAYVDPAIVDKTLRARVYRAEG